MQNAKIFRRNLRNTQGFTLIELIVVIVILGILSAVALPKLTDISDEARKSVIAGFAGAIASATNIKATACVVDKTFPHCAQKLGNGVNGWAPGVTGAKELWQALNPDSCSFLAVPNLLSDISRVPGWLNLYQYGQEEYFVVSEPSGGRAPGSGCWDGKSSMTCSLSYYKVSARNAAGDPLNGGARLFTTPMTISCY